MRAVGFFAQALTGFHTIFEDPEKLRTICANETEGEDGGKSPFAAP
jgi:hypothetical protein